MKRWVAFAAAALLCARGAAAREGREGGAAPRRGGEAVVLVPKGYPMEIRLDDTLDSRTSRAGERVRARLAKPITASGVVVLPEGTRVAGAVTEVKSPKAGLLKASIKFKLDEILTRRGAIPIEASAHLDLGKLAQQGGKMAGTMAAKEVAKSFIPVLGTVYLIQNVAKGVEFVTEEKEITIPAGTTLKLHFDAEARIPAGG